MVRGLAERFPDYGIEGEVYVTAPGAEIEEEPRARRGDRRAHEEVFGEHAGARRDALVLATRRR